MNISEHVTISIELTTEEHVKVEQVARKQGYTGLTDYLYHLITQDLGLEIVEDDPNIEAAFREGWSDIVAGRVYPASSLWDENDDE